MVQIHVPIPSPAQKIAQITDVPPAFSHQQMDCRSCRSRTCLRFRYRALLSQLVAMGDCHWEHGERSASYDNEDESPISDREQF